MRYLEKGRFDGDPFIRAATIFCNRPVAGIILALLPRAMKGLAVGVVVVVVVALDLAVVALAMTTTTNVNSRLRPLKSTGLNSYTVSEAIELVAPVI